MAKEAPSFTEAEQSALIDQMFKAGAHFGYTRPKRHPSMLPYVFGAKNRVDIFDLEKTSIALMKAKQYMEQLGREGKTVLVVGGKHELIEAVRLFAESINMPYVASRWLGGTITNFSEIKRRIDRLDELRTQKESGELEKKYTKKERLLIDREIDRLEANFGGIFSMKSLPQVLLVVDAKQEVIAIREANVKHIPVIGILNTDSDLSMVHVPVPGNDATKSSVTFFLNELAEAYRKGKGVTA
jgi:small subunit ribosomal protein S2